MPEDAAPQFTFAEVRIPVRPDLTEFRREFEAFIEEMRRKITEVRATPEQQQQGQQAVQQRTAGIEELIGAITRQPRDGQAGEANSNLSRLEVLMTTMNDTITEIRDILGNIEAIVGDENRVQN